MKKLLLSFLLIGASFALSAQDFNIYVNTMNGYSRGYSNQELSDLYYYRYNVPQTSTLNYLGMTGNNWGNVALGIEIARILGIPVNEVFGVYRDGQRNGNGWGEVVKRYGIKPGSREFHRMKRAMSQSQSNWGYIFDDYKVNKNAKYAKEYKKSQRKAIRKQGRRLNRDYDRVYNNGYDNDKGNKGYKMNGKGHGNNGKGHGKNK